MCLQNRFIDRHPRRTCGGKIDQITQFEVVPKVVIFAVDNASVKVSKKIHFLEDEKHVVFGLKGVIYTGDFHFTSRVFSIGVV